MTATATRRERLRAILTPPPFDPRTVWDQLGYVPTPLQAEFHAAAEHDVLFGGAVGGGKSIALLMDDIADATHYAGIRIGAFRRTYDELEESFFKELTAIGWAQDLGARWHGTNRELRFPNGSVIRYRYLETVQDASRRQGGEYQKITIDERTLIDPAAVDILTTERLRSGNRVPVIGVRSSSNPGGAGHSKVRARFIEPTRYGRAGYTDDEGRTVRFIPARATDNPHLNATYIRQLDGITDPARRAAMRDGDWDTFAGQVFAEWRNDRHVIDGVDLTGFAKFRAVGIDYGYRAPWAVLWGALDGDGRLWLYRERYETEVGETDQAGRILADEAADHAEIVSWRAADPSMWARKGEAPSPATAYAAAGCSITPATNDRIIGWQRCHSWLAEAPACDMHRAMGWETCPLTHVFASCVNFIRTVPSLPYDRHGGEDADTHAEDHIADAWRYLCMSLPPPATNATPPVTHREHQAGVMDGVMGADAPAIHTGRRRSEGRAEQGLAAMNF